MTADKICFISVSFWHVEHLKQNSETVVT